MFRLKAFQGSRVARPISGPRSERKSIEGVKSSCCQETAPKHQRKKEICMKEWVKMTAAVCKPGEE